MVAEAVDRTSRCWIKGRSDGRSIVAVAGLLGLLAGCSGSSASSPSDSLPDRDAGADSSAPSLNALPGQVALSVLSASATQRGADSGNIKVNVTFLIANGAGSDPLPLNPLLFYVLSEDGLEVRATQGSAQCPAQSNLVAGAMRTCSITTELSQASTPVSLRYALPATDLNKSARTADAPIQHYRPCTPCDGLCVDLEVDEANCGACGVALGRSSAVCQGGTPVCQDDLTFCPSDVARSRDARCVDLQSERRDCGRCGVLVLDGLCENGKPRCSDGMVVCAPPLEGMDYRCATLDDTNHCGACNAECRYRENVSQECEAGRCVGSVFSEYGKQHSCAQVCAEAGFERCTGGMDYDCAETFGYSTTLCYCDSAPVPR